MFHIYWNDIFQLVRNILATNPRVTRFKIDWDDNQSAPVENGENIPPTHNLESESNQMVPGSHALEDIKSQVVPDINSCAGMDVDDTSVSMS